MSPAEWFHWCWITLCGGSVVWFFLIGWEVFLGLVIPVTIWWLWEALPGPWWAVLLVGAAVVVLITLIELASIRRARPHASR